MSDGKWLVHYSRKWQARCMTWCLQAVPATMVMCQRNPNQDTLVDEIMICEPVCSAFGCHYGYDFESHCDAVFDFGPHRGCHAWLKLCNRKDIYCGVWSSAGGLWRSTCGAGLVPWNAAARVALSEMLCAANRVHSKRSRGVLPMPLVPVSQVTCIVILQKALLRQ